MINVGNSLKKFGIEQTFNYVYKNPEPNLKKLMDWADNFAKGALEPQRKVIRNVIENPDHPYHDFVLHMFRDIDPDVFKKVVTNFFINANLATNNYQENSGRNITAIFHGQFFWTPPVPVTCTVPGAGRQRMATGSTSA